MPSKAAARLSAQFNSHEAKKRYCAIVCGHPKPQDYLTDWLYKDETTFSSRVVEKGTLGAKEARLSYALLGQAEETALLDVELYTGRPHQIRVQFSSRNHPLWGDGKYGSAYKSKKGIALWSSKLVLEHPTKKESMTFELDPPDQEPWNKFRTIKEMKIQG